MAVIDSAKSCSDDTLLALTENTTASDCALLAKDMAENTEKRTADST